MIERTYPQVRDAFELTFEQFNARIRAMASRIDLDRDDAESRLAGDKIYTGLMI